MLPRGVLAEHGCELALAVYLAQLDLTPLTPASRAG
jgi:hypothetical protein